MDILLYKGAKSRPTILLESRTKNFTRSQLTRFVLLHQRSLLHTIVEVLLKDSFRKQSFPRIELDIKLLQSIYFAYKVGIISSCSTRICYWKIAKSRTKDVWELHAALRTVFWEPLFNKYSGVQMCGDARDDCWIVCPPTKF